MWLLELLCSVWSNGMGNVVRTCNLTNLLDDYLAIKYD